MDTPWQLTIFKWSLKKKLKVKTVINFMEETQNKTCLEIGCEKGILSYFLRQKGGVWVSTDIDLSNVYTTNMLVKENTVYFKEDALPFLDFSFDCIVAIDTLEHIENDQFFVEELYRILSKSGTLYITVPGSKPSLVLNKLARKMGLTLEYYGHKREGYTKEHLTFMLDKAGFFVTKIKDFSRFFTEGIELFINYLYIFLLNKGEMKAGIKGSISPAKEEDFDAHKLSFKIYRSIYPILWLISQMDKLLFFTSGYVIILKAKKRLNNSGYNMILVTGSTGFIGGHLIRRLIRQKQRVRILVRKESQFEQIGKSVFVEAFYGDLRDLTSLNGIMHNVDIVFHLASVINAKREHKDIYWDTNVFGTQNLLEIIRRERRQIQKFIFCSSVGAMGHLEAIPADEYTQCFPHNLYEKSKFEAEKIVEEFKEREKIAVSIIRPSWVYGPGDMRTLKLFKAIKNRRFFIVGNGKTLIHPVYVEDIVQGLMLCAFEQRSAGQTYIIAGERPLALSELVRVIAEYFNTSIPKFHFPLFLAKLIAISFEAFYMPFSKRPPVSRRSFEFFSKNQSFSISKAKKELGYRPEIDLAKGLYMTIRWYRDHNYL